MSIDEIIAADANKRKSLRQDWALAEAAIGVAPFKGIRDSDISSGLDPDFFAQKQGNFLVDGKPGDIGKSTQLEEVTVLCPICKPKKKWTDNLSARRKRLLQRVHDTKISDYEPADPLDGATVKDTYDEVKGCFEDVTRFECPHGHGQFYTFLSEAVKIELLRNVDKLLAYRRQMRRALKEISGANAEHEPAPIPKDLRDPDDAIEKFEVRQADLKLLIKDGDHLVQFAYETLGGCNIEITFDNGFFTDKNSVPRFALKHEVAGKLNDQTETWRRQRSDLVSRIMI